MSQSWHDKLLGAQLNASGMRLLRPAECMSGVQSCPLQHSIWSLQQGYDLTLVFVQRDARFANGYVPAEVVLPPHIEHSCIQDVGIASGFDQAIGTLDCRSCQKCFP